MVLAVSNALGLPVIIFSSAHHYPLIYITPRFCKISVPLYVAFNQAGAGHYNAVTFDTLDNNPQLLSSNTGDHGCSCGRKGKNYSTEHRCVSIKKKYTSVILCPCLASDKPCTIDCICNNCNNPNGAGPSVSQLPQKRCRQKHAWQEKAKKSSLFALQLQENLTTGPCTQLEYILVSQIMKYFLMKGTDPELHLIHAVYSSCVELANAFDLSLPLGEKSETEIDVVLKEYDKNLKIFKAMCVTQLKINFSYTSSTQ